MRVVEPFQLKNETISSSKIRSLLQEGNCEKASTYLGRPYFIRGLVVKGVQRGKTLGIPTANLKTEEMQVVPQMGVYITEAEYEGKKYQSLTNVGHAPTFSEKTPLSIETYLLNFDHEIYGENLSIHFLKRIRDTQKFASPEALITQIKKDIETAKGYFEIAHFNIT